jgi:hypothetical protein
VVRPPITQPCCWPATTPRHICSTTAAADLCVHPYYAPPPHLTQDYYDRTTLTTIACVQYFGRPGGFYAPLALIGVMRPENAGRVSWMGFCFGLLAPCPVVTFLVPTRAHEYQEQKHPACRSRCGQLSEPSLSVRGRGIRLPGRLLRCAGDAALIS